MEEARFDRYQFDHRKPAVSAETGISFADYFLSMHTVGREGLQRANPHVWAVDDNRLREVIMVYLYRRVMLPKYDCPKNISEMDFAAFARRVDRRSRATVARQRRAGLWVNKQPKEFTGYESIAKYGVSKVAALIAWRVFRLGYDSIQATENLPITPCNVRQICLKMVGIARERWPETCPPVHGYGGKKGNTRAVVHAKKRSSPNVAQCVTQRRDSEQHEQFVEKGIEMKKNVRKHYNRLRRLAARKRNDGYLPPTRWMDKNGTPLYWTSYEVVRRAGLISRFQFASQKRAK